ncbi:GIY-YIG nuclease family protein [Porticoccaceae bacterium]|nr:GIY-YIG nuclease family protein [Porticoccaceae bacterium]
MTEPKLTPGTLYIDRDQDVLSGEWGQYVKIGIVRNDKEASIRNKEHQTGNPRRIHVIFSAESPMVEHLETYLHHIFASLRVLGEWFLLDDNAVQTQVIPIAQTLIEEQRTSLEAFTQKVANKSTASSGISREPTASELALHQQAIGAKHALEILQARQDIIKSKLIQLAAGSGGISGVLDFQTKISRPSLHKSKLKADHPELYSEYETLVLGEPKGLLSIKGTSSLKQLDEELYDEKKLMAHSAATDNSDITRPEVERNSTITDLHQAYLENLKAIASADWLFESFKAGIALILRNDDEIKGVVSWKRLAKEESKFDTDAFAKDHPDMYAKYLSSEKVSIASIVYPSRPYK